MTENQKKILELIKNRNTLRAISEEMNLSPKQTYQRILNLQNKGYNMYRNDYINGDIDFTLTKDIIYNNNSKILFTPHNCNTVRTIILSDTHLGNIKQRLDVLHGTYNYGIKNGIHVIFHCGDFTEGIFDENLQNTMDKDYEKQLEKALKQYPYDKSINNYLVLGNHDNNYLEKENFDIGKAILKKRYDIFPIGYERAQIHIKNDHIHLIHPFNHEKSKFCNKIIYRGHSHQSKQKTDTQNHLYTYVPTCSDIKTNINREDYFELPSILDVTFTFNSYGLICKINTSTYIYLDRFIKVQENEKIFNDQHKVDKIKYERSPKKLTKTRENTNHRMSQIEKFNARYKK